MMNLQLLTANEKNLGAFKVKRFLPSPERRMVGPWIFFDHFGPATLNSEVGLDVRPHPHINLATVTYLFEGEIIHRDSLGCVQPIRPGEINLMVAGKGIVHSERESSQVRQQQRTLHGVQLWCALPEAMEECDPAFYHYSEEEIPEILVNDVRVKVLIGSAYGLSSPVQTFSETFYATVSLKKGEKISLPDVPELALYLIDGRLQNSTVKVPGSSMIVLPENQRGALEAVESSHIVMIGGAPLGQRYIDWNFVSSSKERIEKAKENWRAGLFPTVTGDEEEYIPLPER